MMTDFAYDSLPVIIKLINFLPYTENLFFYDTRFFFFRRWVWAIILSVAVIGLSHHLMVWWEQAT